MNARAISLILTVLSSVLPVAATAAGVADCDRALIVATYARTDSQFLDWRLAKHVSQHTYDEIKHNANTEATVYGIPMGASYDDFQKSIKDFEQSHQESLTVETFRNVAWTGLNAATVSAYTKCLDTEVRLNARGIKLIPKTATASDVTVELLYAPQGMDPNPMKVKWEGSEVAKNSLPTQVTAGPNGIYLKRPEKESTLIVNGTGTTDQIILTPLPRELPPEAKLATRCEITKTRSPLPQIGKSNSVAWACPPMRAGLYAASFSVKPTALGPALAYRVAFTIEVVKGPEGNRESELIGRNPPEVDLKVKTDMPDSFSVSGKEIRIPSGPVTFKLSIVGVADHCCFDRSQGNDSALTIPENVSMRLERLN